jgi:hypothetical protein
MNPPTPDPASLSPEPAQSDSTLPPQPEPAAFETSRALLRLVVGLALIGADDLSARLRGREPARARTLDEMDDAANYLPTVGDTLRALVGFGFVAVDSTARAVSAATETTRSVAGAVTAPLRPIARSRLVRPARTLAERGRQRYARLIQAGLAEERRTRELAANITGLLLEDTTDFAGENAGVQSLVDAQVERLLPALVADPTIQQLLVEQLGEWLHGLTARSESLDPLVRALGDRYIAYLNEHPDDVQNLVQGQAVSMAGEVRDSVRSITVTGDSFLEILARGLLRRPPRDETQAVNIRRRYARIASPDATVGSGEAPV